MSDLHSMNPIIMSREGKTKECELCHIDKKIFDRENFKIVNESGYIWYDFIGVDNDLYININKTYCIRCDYKASRKRQAERYREKNKEKISEKNKVKYTCECGVELRKDGKSKHEKSQGHKKWLENKI